MEMRVIDIVISLFFYVFYIMWYCNDAKRVENPSDTANTPPRTHTSFIQFDEVYPSREYYGELNRFHRLAA